MTAHHHSHRYLLYPALATLLVVGACSAEPAEEPGGTSPSPDATSSTEPTPEPTTGHEEPEGESDPPDPDELYVGMPFDDLPPELRTFGEQGWDAAVREGADPEDRPEVEVLGFYTYEEWYKVIPQCKAEFGFPLQEPSEPGGSASYTWAEGQAVEYWTADYICAAQHIQHPAYYFTEPHEGAYEATWDHYTGPLRECLEAEGYEIEDPPSYEAWREDWHMWNPYDAVPLELQTLELHEQCPPAAEEELVYDFETWNF